MVCRTSAFLPIQPDSTFTYEFPIRQSGTYWYHSHSNLQEQSGVYGAIVIEPAYPHPYTEVDGEHVVLFSDWTTEDPHKVMRSLKRGSEWYAIEKGSSQSILGAARMGMLGEYATRELQRMPAMDIADVAYDYFLANGRPETLINAKSGEALRLRLINGSATTYFYLEFAGGPMTIISADGMAVQPLEQERFLIAVAETYDVLLKVPHSGSYELRATAYDASGYASVWMGNGDRFEAPDVPKPNLYQGMHQGSASSALAVTPAGVMGMPDDQVKAGKFDQPGMAEMGGMDMEKGHGMGHEEQALPKAMEMDHEAPPGSDKHSDAAAISDHKKAGHEPRSSSQNRRKRSPGQPICKKFQASCIRCLIHAGCRCGRYRPETTLAALRKTALDSTNAFDPGKPIREIRLTLDGDMERYVWLLNNKPLSESDVIRIREGEVVRFIMINRTMMHHPMHLHGHFFRVINGQGEYAPLKHTVDVAPMSTTVIEFYGNEFGDWFFHCHLLYHMKSGMARLIHYDGYQPDPEVVSIRPNLFKESWYLWAEADVLSNMTEGAITLSDTRNIFKASWEVGWQDVDGTDWEGSFHIRSIF